MSAVSLAVEGAGIAAALVGVALVFSGQRRSLQLQIEEMKKQGAERGRQLQEMRARREELQSDARRWEQAAPEISALYHLSKRFLGTLDSTEGLQMTEEILGQSAPHLRPEEKESYLKRVAALIAGGEVSVKDLVAAMPRAGESAPEGWAIVSSQLALGLNRIALYGRIQELATHDALTGFLVRRSFLERLHEELERTLRLGGEISLLLVDLDRFKQVNDTHGHLVGDVVLREVAQRIQGSVREMDLAGRYGGEEFGVMLPGAGQELGLQIAERIRSVVEATPIRAYDEEVRMTVSIGVCCGPKDGTAVEQLMEGADQAMYRAKDLGRNRTEVAKR